ncbi:MAG: hypothetical protein IK102_04775 [Treponema sp.]|nr:hypothetical protein [Treponema sp.]
MTNKLVKIFLPLCVVLLFCSCDHFMEGAKIHETLEKTIEYANTPVYKIPVEADKEAGIITKPAAGEAAVKPTDTFNLSFNSESDHQFLRWEVYDAATGNVIKDNPYLKIENPEMIDTTCTVLALPSDTKIKLAVRAVAAQRPQVIFTFPLWQENGVQRNSDIRIKFNRHNMSPECIYYSEEEMKNLKKELGLYDRDFLKGNQWDCGGRYYGYEKDGIRYFKNIQLKFDTTDSSEDPRTIMNYFCDPFWYDNENELGATLVIQTNNIPPEMFKTIYVMLDKNLYYIEDNVQVTLREPSFTIYKTAGWDGDVDPPTNSIFSLDPSIEVDVGDGVYKPLYRQQLTYIDPASDPLSDNIVSALMPEAVPSGNNVEIPVCSDSENIRLRIKFAARDFGGSNLANHFELWYFKDLQYRYNNGDAKSKHRLPKTKSYMNASSSHGKWYAPAGKIPFKYQYIGRFYNEYQEGEESIYGFTNSEIKVDCNDSLHENFVRWETTGEGGDEDVYKIFRTSENGLTGAQTICCAIYMFDNQGDALMEYQTSNTSCLSYNSGYRNEQPYLFWLKLQ